MVNSRIWVFLQYLTCRTDVLSCFAAGRPGVVTGGWAVSSQHRVLVLRRRRCLRHRLRPGELPLSETTQTTLKKQNLLFSSCLFQPFQRRFLQTLELFLQFDSCCTSCLLVQVYEESFWYWLMVITSCGHEHLSCSYDKIWFVLRMFQLCDFETGLKSTRDIKLITGGDQDCKQTLFYNCFSFVT